MADTFGKIVNYRKWNMPASSGLCDWAVMSSASDYWVPEISQHLQQYSELFLFFLFETVLSNGSETSTITQMTYHLTSWLAHINLRNDSFTDKAVFYTDNSCISGSALTINPEYAHVLDPMLPAISKVLKPLVYDITTR